MTRTLDQSQKFAEAIAAKLNRRNKKISTQILDGALNKDTLNVINWIGGDGEFTGAQILIAFSEPSLWIHTETETIEGCWRNEDIHVQFNDGGLLHSICMERYTALMRNQYSDERRQPL